MATAAIGQTPLEKETQKKVNLIIQHLMDNEDSFEFRQPVDVKGLGLHDYFTIIKTPMDLGSVKRNLRTKYKYAEEVLADIQLIWDNCKTYNKEGSWIYKLAEKLEKYTKKLIKSYLPNVVAPRSSRAKEGDDLRDLDDSGGEFDDGDSVSYQDKVKLSQKAKKLTQEQLGQVVKIIQEECSNAFKEVEKDRYQILVDNLNKDTFNKIWEYVDSCMLTESGDQLSKKVKAQWILMRFSSFKYFLPVLLLESHNFTLQDLQ
eukprot:TRINITY_DN2089_c0_g1_i2.p1 TRINITY_DN2089_c0_g1~~TRINITY_DN2089_c0_g1_i2.p1  ORF type:complete len:260 (+),score=43.15 TRINITY_DN2089_c0_g1_i2:80-859(+)